MNAKLRRFLLVFFGVLACAVPASSLVVGVGFGAIDTSTITEWLPIIIEFAMLGMILGLLKKFGKW